MAQQKSHLNVNVGMFYKRSTYQACVIQASRWNPVPAEGGGCVVSLRLFSGLLPTEGRLVVKSSVKISPKYLFIMSTAGCFGNSVHATGMAKSSRPAGRRMSAL